MDVNLKVHFSYKIENFKCLVQNRLLSNEKDKW